MMTSDPDSPSCLGEHDFEHVKEWHLSTLDGCVYLLDTIKLHLGKNFSFFFVEPATSLGSNAEPYTSNSYAGAYAESIFYPTVENVRARALKLQKDMENFTNEQMLIDEAEFIHYYNILNKMLTMYT